MSDEDFALYSQIFTDISLGYSSFILNGKKFFVKHFTLPEQFSLNSGRKIFLEDAASLGLERETDQVKFSIEQGWWSKENEEKIAAFRKTVTNLRKTREKLLYKSQKDSIDVQIKKFEAMLVSLLHDRSGFIIYSCDSYADKKIQEEFFRRILFKDKDLLEPWFNDPEDFEGLDADFVENLYLEINKISLSFKLDNIKRVAASGFFQNLIFLADTSYEFWGKPVSECSKYQNDLLLYGKSYRNFVKNQAENGKALSEDIISDPEKLISFIENYNPNSKKPVGKKTKSENAVSSYVGATKEDLKELGVKVEKVKGLSLLDMAKKSGGIIEKDQYLKARQ